jgi:hypothetical protein
VIAWLAPAAFAAFALLAGPVVVHLLARRNARRVRFPATHFVRATQSAAVKIRRPSDIGLLLVRLAIVSCAVLAAAQPVLLSSWRVARWNARTSRAIVLDTSRSMTREPATDVPSRLADQESAGAFRSRRIEAEELAEGVERAVAWLATTPPSRRELVIVSDFQRGAIDRDVLVRVPTEVGVRTIRAGAPPATRTQTLASIDGWRGGAWQPSMTVDAGGTAMSWVRQSVGAATPWISVTGDDQAAAVRALNAAMSFGVPAGDNARRLNVVLAGASQAQPLPAVRSRWIAAASQALKTSALLQDSGPEVGADRIRVGEQNGTMIVETSIPATSTAAPAVIRSAILAIRPQRIADAEFEVTTISDEELSRWRRDAAPVGPGAISDMADSDGRWLWILALALLGVETVMRRAHVRVAGREADAAAA